MVCLRVNKNLKLEEKMIGDQKQRNKQNINKLKQNRSPILTHCYLGEKLDCKTVRILREFVQSINTRGIIEHNICS